MVSAPRRINLETVPHRSIEERDEVHSTDFQGTWMDPIIRYLLNGEQPPDRREAQRLRRKAAQYAWDGEVLYRRSLTLSYLRCLTLPQAQTVIREVHEGICAEHVGAKALARKILRMGFYWPSTSGDCAAYVRTCPQCQKHASIPRQPPTELTSMSSPWPFAQWGLDILGPFPPSTGQRRFIIAATDYFTKWVEANSLAKITEQNATNFIWKSIFCRFGVPHALVVDNGKQFDNKRLRDLCDQFGVKIKYASVAHPMANGQAENTNKSILQGLKKRLTEAKGAWADELPMVLWAYRTTPRASTQESPFRLAFGVEAVAPAELELRSHRVRNFNQNTNGERMREELDLLEETRESACLRVTEYQRRVARHFNRKVRVRRFTRGDLVLRKSQFSSSITPGKLAPRWDGPYIIKEEVFPGTYRLTTSEGQLVARTWNAEHLKKFYP